jgi:hypothetical protein
LCTGDAYIPSNTNASYLWDRTLASHCPGNQLLGRHIAQENAERPYLWFATRLPLKLVGLQKKEQTGFAEVLEGHSGPTPADIRSSIDEAESREF